MNGFRVDAIVPVHDPTRPVERAVTSLLRSGLSSAELRITVVCHNVAIDDIRRALRAETAARVRFLHLEDRIPSPAGPFTLGIQHADADFLTVMGSDDRLEDGALRAWLQTADRHRLAAFIPEESHDSGGKVRTPAVRPWRRYRLHPLRDRLAYRTAPLGLIRREVIDRLGMTFPRHLLNGSDQLFGLKLWFSGEPIAYGRGLPGYVVGSDARTRVTTKVRPAAEDLAAILELVEDPWFVSRSLRERRAIVVKTVRVHLFSGALIRTGGNRWTDADRKVFSDAVDLFHRAAPGFSGVLSLADGELLDAVADGRASILRLSLLLAQRRRFGRPRTVLTRDIRNVFASDAPLRFMVASRLL